MTNPLIPEAEADEEHALAAATLADDLRMLAARDPRIAAMLERVGCPAPRRRQGGLAGLAAIVIAQQVSTASAAAINARFSAAFPGCAAEHLLLAEEASLRACGLSAPKIRTLRAAAAAVAEGELPLDALHAMPADAAHAALCAVKGVGPWTADIYLMFCLGHRDAFPSGDLALQESARLAWNLPERPSAKALAAMAEAWRPARAAAAALLWAFYKTARGREGVLPPA